MPTTPFTGGYRITQAFGRRPEYYKQFGFAGHEGLDLVPLTPDKRLIIVEDGEVIRDVDPGERFDAYGYLTCVWNPITRRCWWYAHSAFNLLEPGDKVKRGQTLGQMGSSGNVDGAHLHLGLTISDANKVRLNTNNGYKGFVDPLPVLEELNKSGVSMPTEIKTMTVEIPLFEKVVNNSNKWDSTVKYVELPSDPATTSFEDVQRVIAGFKSRVTDLQNQVNKGGGELDNRLEQVSRLKDQLTNDLKVANELLIAEKEARMKGEQNVALVMTQVTAKQNQIDELAKEKGALNTEVVTANQKAKEWKEKYDELLKNHAVSTVTLADAVLILVKSFFGWAKNVQLKKVDDIDLSSLTSTATKVVVENL